MSQTYVIETSLTLDYRRTAWGIERIVLDSISNHLPEDSNGSATSVRIKQDGRYAALNEADQLKPTEEVVFEDDGSGYDAGLLSVLFSPKSDDALSVGQFGEGLKMVAAAALRNGLSTEYRSRNWIATPFATSEAIGDYSVRRLCFRVTENGDNLEGSRTIFTNPSAALMEEILQLPKKVLALNGEYQELHNEKDTTAPIKFTYGYASRIIDLGDGTTALFVKGVRVQVQSSLFSYDLGLESIAPDRTFVDRDKLLNMIESLLKGCSNPRVIEAVLREAHENPRRYCYEFEAFKDRRMRTTGSYLRSQTEFTKREYDSDRDEATLKSNRALKLLLEGTGNLWADTFRSVYGENAVIASQNPDVNKDAELMGYNPVRLNEAIADYLVRIGIQNADGIDNAQEYRWVDDCQLTAEEMQTLGRVAEIKKVVFGDESPVETLEVRVYSGLFSASGREIESSNGAYFKGSGNERPYIGVKRSTLGSLEVFVKTYLHELGHQVTSAGDYSRIFEDFFVSALARLAMQQIEGK